MENREKEKEKKNQVLVQAHLEPQPVASQLGSLIVKVPTTVASPTAASVALCGGQSLCVHVYIDQRDVLNVFLDLYTIFLKPGSLTEYEVSILARLAGQ